MKSVQSFFAVLVCLLLTSGMAACKKSKPKPVNNTSVKEMLVNKQWKITAAILETPADINGDGTPDTDVYTIKYKGKCKEDDTKQFFEDGTLHLFEGAWSCPSGERPSWIWGLDADNTHLLLTPSFGDSITWQIISITANELKIRYLETKMFGQEAMDVVVTYTKQ